MSRLRKLTILYDANAIAISGKSGVGHYAAYLLQALADAYPDELRIVAHYYNFLGRKTVGDLPVAPNISYRVSRLWPGRATNALRRLGIGVPFEALTKSRGDVVIFPNFLTLPSIFNVPTVTAIHDLGFIEYPQFVSDRNLRDLRTYVPQSVRRSSLILAPSEFTKRSLEQSFGVPPDTVLVTPIPPLSALKPEPDEAGRSLRRLGVPSDYLLFVGNLEPRKNLLKLLDAYLALSSTLRAAYPLVIAGGTGWKNQDVRQRIADLQAAGEPVITTGYVSDADKAALYSRSSLVVLPAMYEGFGMQILEAFQYGVPVAISDISVFHEVAGDAAAYFDPLNSSAMATVIARCLEDDAYREKIIRGQQRELRKYSWAATIRQLYDRLRYY